jgi:stage III sporulation protein AA
MNLNFLPQEIKNAIAHININFLSEIRIRKGQAVIIEYCGEYKYINSCGISKDGTGKILVNNIDAILNCATGGSIYAYAEQLKKGFITVDGGIRIGVAGEYVQDLGKVTAIRKITSLNIRIPHDADGCATFLYKNIAQNNISNLLVFSQAGLGKTTMLRDIAKHFSKNLKQNILVFDERNEIAAFDGENFAFNLGENVDVVRGGIKLTSFENAVRALKPQVIICDELYGGDDIKAVSFCKACGIKIFASSHISDKEKLSNLPFDYFAQLTGIGSLPIIYDKDFNIISDNNSGDTFRISSFAE